MPSSNSDKNYLGCGRHPRLVKPVLLLADQLASALRQNPRFLSLLAIVLASLIGVATTAQAGETPPLGRVVAPHTLPDVAGQTVELFAPDAKLTVVAFLGVECPLARVYCRRINQLAQEYGSRGVRFLAVDSNQQDSPDELRKLGEEFSLVYPLLVDEGNVLADAMGAERTPQVLVLDDQHAIRYSGRVDDQHAFRQGVGYQRTQASRHDLREALDDLLAGQPVRVAETPLVGCLIGRRRPVDEQAEITWSSHVAAIVQRRCQECHRPGEVAPFPLLTYEDAAGWQEMIREVVHSERMPPWGADSTPGQFKNDARLTADERRTIVEWIDHGAPRGDSALEPPPREFIQGWQIGEPDEVFYMNDVGFPVPAEGLVDYQYFEIDPGFTEDRWVKAVECRAGAPAVVHHINVFLVTPDMPRDYEREDLTNHLLWGTAPGLQSITFGPGMAYRIPAGTKLVWQMHYTTTGLAQVDRSYMGLQYARPDEVRTRVEMKLAVNPHFAIPPGAENHAVESLYELPQDGWIYALSPHMHLRGKAFRYDLYQPDSTHQLLVDVPRFDFNWQHIYVLSEPLPVRRGAIVHCTGWFDNSAQNPTNPNPREVVHWGDQIWEEMMIGYILLAFDRDVVKPEIRSAAIERAQHHERRRQRAAQAATVAAVLGAVAATGAILWRRAGG